MMDANEKNGDPFLIIEEQIRSQFEADIEVAREAAKKKMDSALQQLESLRSAYGSAKPPAIKPKANGVAPIVLRNGGTMKLKAAMIEATIALHSNITRKLVMDWVTAKYPHLKDQKEGTLASTFSRLKSDNLVPMSTGANMFRRKEVQADE